MRALALLAALCSCGPTYADALALERARSARLERALDQLEAHFAECQTARQLDQAQPPACHDTCAAAARPAP
jgi:hypothetical protein